MKIKLNQEDGWTLPTIEYVLRSIICNVEIKVNDSHGNERSLTLQAFDGVVEVSEGDETKYVDCYHSVFDGYDSFSEASIDFGKIDEYGTI